MTTQPDSLAVPRFSSSLPRRKVHTRIAVSVAIHVAVVMVVAQLPSGVPLPPKPKRQDYVRLVAPTPVLKPPVTQKIQPPLVQQREQFEFTHQAIPAPKEPRRVSEPLTPRIRAAIPKADPIPSFEPAPLVPMPEEKPAGFANPAATPPENTPKLAVQSGGFSSAESKSLSRTRAPRAYAAGFGTVANNLAPSRGVARRAVAGGGFGTFRRRQRTERMLKSHENQPISSTNVEILSKPRPRYTDQARDLKLEGTVAFSVVFQSDGRVRVVELLESLGAGLDETAREAALAIQFKPATQDGRAVDTSARLSIVFQMAY